VQDNDPEAFVRSILGPKISPKLEKLVHDQLFPTVRKAMGLTEYETVSEATEESAQLDKHTPNVKELAKRYTTSDSAVQRQLAKGIKTEFEHTSNIDVAREIALDHLGERLDYYDKLAKIEKEDVDESWSKKYKKSINCSNPKGFSQKAHCAGRRARQSGKKTKSKSVSENFADGKGPGKPGDSQRHGIPKGATIAQLEKAAKAPGRKGQLARWQLNMRRGKKRAQENGPIAFGGGPGGNADSGPLIDRQVAPFPWDIYTPHPKEIDEVKVPAAEIVKYVRKIHPEGEWNIDYTITDHPFWTLKTVPINRLHIFDPDQEEIEDPYNRVQDTNLDHVRRLMPNIANNLKQNPIVVDHRGYVLDGNHRALAAAKAGLTSIPVWMPAKEGVDETLKKVKGKWALVSRHDPKKVLQYYHGSGHPSKEWVSKVERRIHSFSEDVEETIKPRVYIDMDGVIADFFGEWTRLSGVDHYKDIEDVEAKLQLVREHPTFWVDLPVLPHAKALIKTVIDHFGEYRICSKPLEGDARSKPGKMEWIRKHLSDMPPAEVILTADKAAYAKHAGIPSVLIDDFGKNVMSWRAAGGIAIKYEDEHFREVAAILERIARSGVSK
jgi:5'(3')-deoxyribonucleotidase